MRIGQFIFSFFLFISLSACTGQKNQSASAIITDVESTFQLEDKFWKIFQDSKGTYWFGSNGRGIYLYDSSELKSITIDDGLVDNTIRGFQEDQFGNVYIETPKGVSKYDGTTFKTIRINDSKTNQWKLEPNDLWFTCNVNAKDVYRYDGKELYELQLPKQDLEKAFGFTEAGQRFNPYGVFGINKDNDGNIWFGTCSAGAFRYDGKSFLWFDDKELSILEDGRIPGVRFMIQDKEGYFWLSNFISKYKVENTTPATFTKLKGMETESLGDILPYFNSGIIDQNGVLWMSTYSKVIWNYDGKNLNSLEVQNTEKEVLVVSIYEDKKGVLWLGTDNDGVYRFNGKKFEKFNL